jgi:hypothetical protein
MRTINAEVVLAGLREIGTVLDAGPRSGPMAAVTVSNAILRTKRLIAQIEGQATHSGEPVLDDPHVDPPERPE